MKITTKDIAFTAVIAALYAVLLVGYIVCLIVRKKPEFYKLIQANRNLEFRF